MFTHIERGTFCTVWPVAMIMAAKLAAMSDPSRRKAKYQPKACNAVRWYEKFISFRNIRLSLPDERE
jgi:hypothetical protein